MAKDVQHPEKSLQEVIDDVGTYPEEAYTFVHEGLNFTQERIHAGKDRTETVRHINGRDLCIGLRDLAIQRWGLLAKSVLNRWNITCTMDFGRIVFALVDASHLQKTAEDSPEDFRDVYDFTDAFERGFEIKIG